MVTINPPPCRLSVLSLAFWFCLRLSAQSAVPTAEWQQVSPETVGINSTKLKTALTGLPGNIVVVRHGQLVASQGEANKPIPLYSVGKSLTAIVFGALLQRGLVTYDQLVPGSDQPSTPLASYRQFMNMTSAFGHTPHQPGTNYAYNNMAVHHYGNFMARTFYGGAGPAEVLQQEFWNLIGREDQGWFQGQWGGWDGGFAYSARDAARIGLLVLRRGNWNGRQIVPASFVDALYLNQIPSSATMSNYGGPDTYWNQLHVSTRLPGRYSFGWWTNAANAFPSVPTRTIYAQGLFGNYIVVCPEYDLVVVKTSAFSQEIPLDQLLNPIISSIELPSQPEPPPSMPAVSVTGELKKWHNVTLGVTGPSTSETASPNPFLDYRLQVTFTNGSRTFVVPGYYAADGNAANTGATAGNQWRVHFVPDAEGIWTYSISFRSGPAVAIGDSAFDGSSVAPDGATGSFQIGATDKSGADFRAKGTLRHSGERYFRHLGNGEYFLKGGADSPENFLAYFEFDQTTAKHRYDAHAGDWMSGDPVWAGNRGRHIIGALNYLASKGMNSVYFLTLNVGGDGNDVWPWTSISERVRYDVSKLDQWEVVFSHMDQRGLAMHVVTQETENDQLLDGGALGTQRRLYYRELIARFGHHLGIVWNLGEENTNTDQQRRDFANYIRSLDPYDHPIAVHSYPWEQDIVLGPLVGFGNLNAASVQTGDPTYVHADTIKWITRAAGSGHPWVVASDEIGPADVGVVPDSFDFNHDRLRKEVLWGNLMAGGAGVEWYFGYAYPHNDLNMEDWRSRDNMWNLTRHALTFFRQYLPFSQMSSNDSLTSNAGDFCLAAPGQIYAIYMPQGGTTDLDFGASTSTFNVRWFNPRTGGGLYNGTVTSLSGPGPKSIGAPPMEATSDWVALVSLAGGPPLPSVPLPAPGSGGLVVIGLTLIDADTNQPIMELSPGSVISLASLPTRNLNIRASTSPSIVGSVRFGLNGNGNFRTENAAPYALAGDTAGDYWPWIPALGTHTVTATAFTGPDGTGWASASSTMTFQVIESTSTPPPAPSPAPTPTLPSGPSITGFTLINADTNQPIGALTSGTTLTLSTLATRNLNVRAETAGTVGSVRFTLDGNFDFRTESSAPFALAGDNSADYWPWTPAFGLHTLTATPFSDIEGVRIQGTALSITFQVVESAPAPAPQPSPAPTGPTITGFTLINADTNQPIGLLPNGAILRLSSLPTRNLNIRADTSPAIVGSVRFALDANSNFRLESTAPYALAGDLSGDYLPWTPATGFHSLTATPSTLAGGTGTAGPSVIINFTVYH